MGREVRKQTRHILGWGRRQNRVPGRGNSKCKDPDMRASIVTVWGTVKSV